MSCSWLLNVDVQMSWGSSFAPNIQQSVKGNLRSTFHNQPQFLYTPHLQICLNWFPLSTAGWLHTDRCVQSHPEPQQARKLEEVSPGITSGEIFCQFPSVRETEQWCYISVWLSNFSWLDQCWRWVSWAMMEMKLSEDRDRSVRKLDISQSGKLDTDNKEKAPELLSPHGEASFKLRNLETWKV